MANRLHLQKNKGPGSAVLRQVIRGLLSAFYLGILSWLIHQLITVQNPSEILYVLVGAMSTGLTHLTKHYYEVNGEDREDSNRTIEDKTIEEEVQRRLQDRLREDNTPTG